MLEVMTQEAQGTKVGRRSRRAEASVSRTARRGMQCAWPWHWLAHSPGQGCPPRDWNLLGASTVPGVHLHPWAPQVGKLRASQMPRERGSWRWSAFWKRGPPCLTQPLSQDHDRGACSLRKQALGQFTNTVLPGQTEPPAIRPCPQRSNSILVTGKCSVRAPSTVKPRRSLVSLPSLGGWGCRVWGVVGPTLEGCGGASTDQTGSTSTGPWATA